MSELSFDEQLQAEAINKLPFDDGNNAVREIMELTHYAVSGETDPLKAYIELKKIGKNLSVALETLQPLALEEAHKYGKSFEFHGAKVECKSAAGKWDFTEIPEWVKINNLKKEIEDKAKQAFKLSEKGDLLIDEGGVIYKNPKYTPGKSIISIEL